MKIERQIELTRRELVGVLSAAGIGGLAGCNRNGGDVERIEPERQAVWEANYAPYNLYPFTDVFDYEPEWYLHVKRSTSLQYLGTTWNPYGNPRSESEGKEQQGGWQHTFYMSSLSLAITHEIDGEYYIRDPNSGGNPDPDSFQNKHVINCGKDDVPLINNDYFDEDRYDSDDDNPFIIPEEVSQNTAVSARRDDDFYSIYDSGELKDNLNEKHSNDENEFSYKNLISGDITGVTQEIETGNVNVNQVRTAARRSDEEGDLFIDGVSIAGSAAIGIVVSTAPLGGPFIAAAAAAGVSIVGLLASTVTGKAIERPNTVYNRSIANSSDNQTKSEGFHILFDVYTAPNETGGFTARAINRAAELLQLPRGRDVSDEYLFADVGSSLWRIEIDSPGVPDGEDGKVTRHMTSSGAPIAKIKHAYFNKNRDYTVGEPDERSKWNFAPVPKPAIAGPVGNVDLNDNEYTAEGTVLAGSHIAEYEWEVYRVSPPFQVRYLKQLFVSALAGDSLPSFVEFLTGSEDLIKREKSSKDMANLPKEEKITVNYDQGGKHLIRLRVKDRNRVNAENDPEQEVADDAVFGVAECTQEVAVGGAEPIPRITVANEGSESQAPDSVEIRSERVAPPIQIPSGDESDESTFVLSGAASEPKGQISGYQWLILGPLPKSDVDLSNIDFNELLELLVRLNVERSPIISVTGQTVDLERPFGSQFYFAALIVVTEFGNWATAFRPIEIYQPRYVASPDPKSTFLQPTRDGEHPRPAEVALNELGVSGGDELTFEIRGDYEIKEGSSESATGTMGVFSENNTLLDESEQNRVPGAIAPEGNFENANPGSVDIPEDFVIRSGSTVTVPAEAAYLFICPRDVPVIDNSDPEDNYRVIIQR